MHYIHEGQIRCKADEMAGKIYTMPNGDTVLAWCEVTAKEYHAEASTRHRETEKQPENELQL